MVDLASKVNTSSVVRGTFDAFDRALKSGLLPTSGKVTERLVRSAFSSLERAEPSVSAEQIACPFPAPHNLSWYFGKCLCPADIRAFAGALGKGSVRIWSAAVANSDWRILAQVFDAEDAEDARGLLAEAAAECAARLKRHTLDDVVTYNSGHGFFVEAVLKSYVR